MAVIGAGFTGLVAGLTLARAGRSVLVLEADAPGHGASTRNGGMIGSGHRLSFDRLARRHGRAAAADILREGIRSLDFTVDLIAREGIACRLAIGGRFRAADRPAHYDAMGREADQLKREIGLEAEMVPRAEQHREIASDAYHGGCVYPRHGGLHPGLFHLGLLERADAAGVIIAGHTPVLGLTREGGRIAVHSSRGRVLAGDAIVATNGYTGAATPALRRRIVPVSSYIIATERLAPSLLTRLIPGHRMIVETRRLHCYYRIAPDGSRLLFGGRAAVHAIDPRRSGARLHRLMNGLFPELANTRVSHSWGGRLGFTRDKLPHLGRRDGVHYALGYNGSGVAMAPWLGHRVAGMVLDTAEAGGPLASLPFSPPPLYTGRPWFLPFMDAGMRGLERLGR